METMNRIFQKPDGVIELGISSCCCPPSEKRPGQHTNAITSWYRCNDNPWSRCRSVASLLIPAEAAESCDDFERYIVDIYLSEEKP